MWHIDDGWSSAKSLKHRPAGPFVELVPCFYGPSNLLKIYSRSFCVLISWWVHPVRYQGCVEWITTGNHLGRIFNQVAQSGNCVKEFMLLRLTWTWWKKILVTFDSFQNKRANRYLSQFVLFRGWIASVWWYVTTLTSVRCLVLSPLKIHRPYTCTTSTFSTPASPIWMGTNQLRRV